MQDQQGAGSSMGCVWCDDAAGKCVRGREQKGLISLCILPPVRFDVLVE